MKNMVVNPAASARRACAVAATAIAVAALAGCAVAPNANPRDPFEPFNRKVTKFNEKLDSIALKPAATAYQRVLPPLVRTGVSNFFGNLGDAWSGVNSLLQLKIGNAAEDILRFSFNTVFGFGGVLDIAGELNVERHKEDFGQTLGRWGVPSGPYLVLPFFGPSTVRDAFALPVDWRGDPVTYVHDWDAQWSLWVLRTINARANLLRATNVLSQAALDQYSFTRDAYLQHRRAEIFDGRVPAKDGQEPNGSKDGGSGDDEGYIPPAPGDDDGYIPPAPDDAPPPAPASK